MAAARPNASLYIGNLAPEIAEATLFEIFAQVGPVSSARICRDNITRRSLSYGYVNYTNPTDAERALDTLNYTLINGRPVRIMWSQRDPALRKSGVGNIFIKNLDKAIDNKSLHDTFSAFGNILSCKVMLDENGVSRGFGFVHFETAEAAETAIGKVNGMLLNEKKVFVGHHVSRRERSSKYEEMKKNFTNVFVKNFDENLSDAAFEKLFTPYGKIASAIIMRDEAGKSRAFGFVNFATHEEAAACCDAMNESEHDGKKLFVGRAQKKAERREELHRKHEATRQEKLQKYQGVNLYVKNLDDTVDEEKLRTEFAPYGTITSSKIQVDEKGNSRGFGFVCYATPEEATKAVTAMNGKMIGQKPIYVALAQRKEVRRQHLEAQYAQRNQMRMAQQSGVLGGPMYPQPMFYPQQRQQFMYPPMMPPRPRWNQSGAQGQNPQEAGGYPAGGAQGRPRSQGPPRARPAGPAGPRVPGPNGVQPGQPPRNAGPAGAGPGGRNFKYTQNVRNQHVGASPAGAAAPAAAHPSELTASALAGASPAEQKQILGERLYMSISEKQPQLAGKITGMLLDMDNAELIHLLESAEALASKVEEAINVLREHDPELSVAQ